MNNLSNERFEEGAKLSRDALDRTCHFQKATAPKSEGDCTANRREFWGWEAKRGDTKELFTTHFSRSLLAPDRLLCSDCCRSCLRVAYRLQPDCSHPGTDAFQQSNDRSQVRSGQWPPVADRYVAGSPLSRLLKRCCRPRAASRLKARRVDRRPRFDAAIRAGTEL